MGVVNATPDSFSDGGTYNTLSAGVARAMEMIAHGVDILDIGGESTRPGAVPVPVEEEQRRTVPLIKALMTERSDLVISIDTRNEAVARAAVSAGACIVNDVSACTHSKGMASLIADSGVGVVLMHMLGQPRTMQEHPVYTDVLGEVTGYLGQRAGSLIAAGVAPEQILLDPGIGFGKTLAHNLTLLRGIPELIRETGFPLLVGLSRKRMLGEITGRDVNDRLAGSLAGMCVAIERGAQVIRVHDAKESCDAARVLDMVRRTSETEV